MVRRGRNYTQYARTCGEINWTAASKIAQGDTVFLLQKENCCIVEFLYEGLVFSQVFSVFFSPRYSANGEDSVGKLKVNWREGIEGRKMVDASITKIFINFLTFNFSCYWGIINNKMVAWFIINIFFINFLIRGKLLGLWIIERDLIFFLSFFSKRQNFLLEFLLILSPTSNVISSLDPRFGILLERKIVSRSELDINFFQLEKVSFTFQLISARCLITGMIHLSRRAIARSSEI